MITIDLIGIISFFAKVGKTIAVISAVMAVGGGIVSLATDNEIAERICEISLCILLVLFCLLVLVAVGEILYKIWA